MDKLREKIEDAARIINDALSERSNFVAMASGGKDSTVMLHLMKFVLGLNPPVLFHREPYNQEKYLFAMALFAKWGCSVHDYAPLFSSLIEGEETMGAGRSYQIGVTEDRKPVCFELMSILHAPKEGQPYLCGKVDILSRPTGTFNYPWNVAFVGHRSADQNPLNGKMPLKVEILKNPVGPWAAFPLKNWTDKEIWDYLDSNEIPVQNDRYDRIARIERKDKSKSGDHFTACIRCVDRRLKGRVMCPKLGYEIDNISSQVIYTQKKLDYWGD